MQIICQRSGVEVKGMDMVADCLLSAIVSPQEDSCRALIGTAEAPYKGTKYLRRGRDQAPIIQNQDLQSNAS